MLHIGRNLTAEQRLQKAVVKIMDCPKYYALSCVLMIGDRKIIDDPLEKGGCTTACTNGRDEWYVRAFVDSLNDKELRFLILHENYHKLYRHLVTWKHLVKKNPDKANIAMDMVINNKIVDDNEDGFATMTGELRRGFINPRYRGWDTAKVFHDLPDTPEDDGRGQGQGEGQKGFDTHDHDGAEDMDVKAKRDLERDLDEAIRQGALMAGKLGSGGDRELGKLLKVQVDWKKVLRDFTTSTCKGRDYGTWNKVNRRFIGQGIYMPSTISEKIGGIVWAIDTSGSIGSHELNAFLSEGKGIVDTVRPDWVRILYWDTEVCADEMYESKDIDRIVQSTKPEGGGGTMVECVPAHMSKHSITPQCVVVLTDGYLGGSWGRWNCPVLWCIIDNDDARPTVGKYVHINSYDM